MRIHRRILVALGLILVALFISPWDALSATQDPLAKLGKPTNAVFKTQPLGEIARKAPNLHRGKKLELLYLNDINDPVAAPERWAIVKALAQFGAFSNLATIGTQYRVPGGATSPVYTISTYDWRHADYHSPYFTFVHYDDLSTPQNIPKEGERLIEFAFKKASNIQPRLGGMTVIGKYFHSSYQEVVPGYLTTVGSTGGGIPFATMQQMMRAGYEKHYSDGVFAFDAESNALTALICKADGAKPSQVCGRGVIKKLMKHLH